jgi:diguanylate cyclase (GGDEF)-like protein
MATNEEILKVVSNETISAVHDLSIVTPSIYTSYFTKNASSYGADLGDESKLTDTLLDAKIQMCNLFQEQTAQNALKLSDSTSKAILAIKAKDEVVLNKVLEETNELRREIQKLKEAVYKDELTNVYNRKWMHDQYLLDDNVTFKNNGTLAIVDLNYFKQINDTFGHIVGDKVLIFVANQLRITKESVVRYGGDEFIVLFSGTIDQDTAYKKLSQIRENVIAKKLKSGENSFRVSFSIGAYEFSEGETLSSVIELADKNMYTDKQKIKTRIKGID